MLDQKRYEKEFEKIFLAAVIVAGEGVGERDVSRAKVKLGRTLKESDLEGRSDE